MPNEDIIVDFSPMIFTITLSDGTVLDNLTMDQNVFISEKEVTPATFERRLESVTFSSGDMSNTHGNMYLKSLEKVGDKWHFELKDMTEEEVFRMNTRSDMDFLAMMSGIDL